MSTIDFARNVTFGRYLPADSFPHRMNPVYKVWCWLAYVVALFFADGYLPMAVLAAVLYVAIAAAKIPLPYALRVLRPALPVLVVVYVFQLVFSRSLYPDTKNLWWQWGIFSITGEGVYHSTLLMMRLVLLTLSVTLLTLCTTVVSLVDALERMATPLRRIGFPTDELALAASIALRFVPTLAAEARRLIVAQVSRGGDAESGNPLRRIRARLAVLVPLIVATLKRGQSVTEAMDARCYRGGRDRTRWRSITARPADRWCLAAALALLALVGFAAFGLNLP